MNRKDIYEFLISVGADKDKKDYHGNTAEDYLKGAKYKGSFGLDLYRKKD